MTTVIDASAAVTASTELDGWSLLEGHDLTAPPLLWPEVRSVLHRSVVRAGVLSSVAERSRARFEQAPVRQVTPDRLSETVWSIADAFGWARTYDAEYLAVAQLTGGRLLTLDTRMRRAAERLGIETADV